MNDFDYYLQLNRLIDNALLHLLSSVAASERMLPTPRRNDILVHFLKPKLKDKEYKLVRKDVRAMLQVARRLNGNLERKLYALTALSESLGLTDLERLYRLFTYLEQQHGMPSAAHHRTQIIESDVVYFLDEHIEHCFDKGKQVAPVSLLIQTERAQALVADLKAREEFAIEVKEHNQQQLHFLLHPHTSHLK